MRKALRVETSESGRRFVDIREVIRGELERIQNRDRKGVLVSENESARDFNIAVMKAMQPLPCVNPGYTTEAELTYERERCAKWRQWVETAPQLDNCTRQAYLEWVEFCEYKNARAEKELITKDQERAHERWKAKCAAQDRRVAEIQVVKPEIAI